MAWTRPPSAWFWMRYGHDAPAGQCAGVLVSEPVRYAAELRRVARAGARSSAVGSLRRSPVLIRQQATRQTQDLIWGSRRVRDLGQAAGSWPLRDPLWRTRRESF